MLMAIEPASQLLILLISSLFFGLLTSLFLWWIFDLGWWIESGRGCFLVLGWVFGSGFLWLTFFACDSVVLGVFSFGLYLL